MGKKNGQIKESHINVGLNLLVDNPGSADAVLPIGWCVAPKTLETIQRQMIVNPHLVIIVASIKPNWRYNNPEQNPDVKPVYDFKEVERRLVPLKQGLEYIQINKAGKYRLFATIVGSDGDIQ